MDWDDVKKPAAAAMTLGESLTTLSVGELEHRIKAFEAEIARVKDELAKKRAHEAAAAKLFKS